MTSWDRLPGWSALGTRTQQVSSALPISSAAMRSMSSSVSCVSCSTPPPVPVSRHQDQHGRPREPQDQAQTNPRAHGNNDGPTTQLPASDYTPGSPRPSDHDVSGRPARFSLRTGLRARRRPATTLSIAASPSSPALPRRSPTWLVKQEGTSRPRAGSRSTTSGHTSITRNQTGKHQPNLDNAEKGGGRCVVPGGAEGI